MEAAEQGLARTLRQVYGPLLINGPFTVIIARHGEMIGLGDRIRLRPLTAAACGSRLYLASEEAPIRLICPYPERFWTPVGGEPVVGRLEVGNWMEIGCLRLEIGSNVQRQAIPAN